MDDHSVKRRTTKELDTMLAKYLREENYADYEHKILEILSVLEEREQQEREKCDKPPEVSSQ